MTAPSALPVDYIDTDAALIEACARWQHCPALALDTEFERVRTFSPILALVQVCDGARISLIDAPAIKNWTAFAALLSAAGIEKIMHAAGEDIEAFDVAVGAVPAPLFDTQAAMAFLQDKSSLGYAPMVQQFFALTLSKDAARTDWLARPLSEEQLRYAAADVLYLLPIWAHLKPQLQQQERLLWLVEDGLAQVRKVREPEPVQSAWRRVKQGFLLRGAALCVARELYALRDQLARAGNQPRSFIMRDEALFTLCEKMPRTWNELAALNVLHPRILRTDGRAILDSIERAVSLPREQWPAPITRLIDIPAAKAANAAFALAVSATAKQENLAAEWLLSKRQQELLIMAAIENTPAPASWYGWRARLLVGRLREILAQQNIAEPAYLAQHALVHTP